jgi:DNA-binding GntR family transcriptional regulator
MNIAKRRRPKRAADLADRISERLVEAIVSHELLPGMPLREAKLAKEWGISRTPLREAIREAAAMGLLELRPNRTPVIRQLTADDVAKLYTVRETLELLALDLALERIGPSEVERVAREAERLKAANAGVAWTKLELEFDSHLHGLWFEHCNNRWLEDVLGKLWTFIRILQQVVARDPSAVQRAFQEHLLILEALAARDHPGVRAALRQHIRSSADFLIKYLRAIDAANDDSSRGGGVRTANTSPERSGRS